MALTTVPRRPARPPRVGRGLLENGDSLPIGWAADGVHLGPVPGAAVHLARLRARLGVGVTVLGQGVGAGRHRLACRARVPPPSPPGGGHLPGHDALDVAVEGTVHVRFSPCVPLTARIVPR